MRRLLIRLVPVVTARELMTPETGRSSILQSGALVPLSLEQETPLVVDHDEDRRVGKVLDFYEADDSGGGRWTWARCEVTDAPGCSGEEAGAHGAITSSKSNPCREGGPASSAP